MKRIAAFLFICCAAGTVRAAPASDTPSARALLDAVIDRLPQETLVIDGDLIVRRQRGIVEAEYRFSMRLAWGESPPTAAYTIRDAFGADIEQLTVARQADGTASQFYATGSPLEPASVPPLDRHIGSTDMTWTDLTLSFLWWPGGDVVGEDSVRGRDCYVLLVPDPAPPEGQPPGAVRLWVDRELYLLLQAEALDSAGEPQRKLWVRSLKKTNERWMIKDLEVQSYPAVHRTRMHVNKVTEEAPS